MTKRTSFLKGLLVSAIIPAASFAATMDSRIDTLEKKVDASTTTNSMGTIGANDATALPITNYTGWHAQIGFVYTQPKVGGTTYAMTVNTPGPQQKTTQEVYEMDYKWTWGLTAGFGYKTNRNWDAAVDYTNLSNSSSNSVSSGLTSAVVPLRAQFDLLGVAGSSDLLTSVDRAKSDSSISLNSFDTTLANVFFTQSMFSMGLKSGVRTQWAKIKQDITYSGGDTLDVNAAYVYDSSRFWGMGPTATLQNNWVLGKGFTVFANTGMSLLYGRFNVSNEMKYSAIASRDFLTRTSFGRIVPEVDMNLGLSYGTFVGNNSKHYITLSLAWDFHYFFNINQMLNDNGAYVVDGSVISRRGVGQPSEDMSLSGLAFQFRWDF